MNNYCSTPEPTQEIKQTQTTEHGSPTDETVPLQTQDSITLTTQSQGHKPITRGGTKTLGTGTTPLNSGPSSELTVTELDRHKHCQNTICTTSTITSILHSTTSLITISYNSNNKDNSRSATEKKSTYPILIPGPYTSKTWTATLKHSVTRIYSSWMRLANTSQSPQFTPADHLRMTRGFTTDGCATN